MDRHCKITFNEYLPQWIKNTYTVVEALVLGQYRQKENPVFKAYIRWREELPCPTLSNIAKTIFIIHWESQCEELEIWLRSCVQTCWPWPCHCTQNCQKLYLKYNVTCALNIVVSKADLWLLNN
jgi:hypothetical protein